MFVFQLQVQAGRVCVCPHRCTAGPGSQNDSPHIHHTVVLRTRCDTDTVLSPEHTRTALITLSHSTWGVYLVSVSSCLLFSCLVTDVGQRVGRITAAGLTPGRSVHVPVSVLALVAVDAQHPLPAGTLSCQWVTETRTPQRTVGHLSPPPVTGALCQPNAWFLASSTKPRVSGSYLCSPVPERCRSNQVCSPGSGLPWCCGGRAGILPSRHHRRLDHPDRCCCCKDTAHSYQPAMPTRHSNQGCICHSLALKKSQRHNFTFCSWTGPDETCLAGVQGRRWGQTLTPTFMSLPASTGHTEGLRVTVTRGGKKAPAALNVRAKAGLTGLPGDGVAIVTLLTPETATPSE